jgi:hypothetical protein
MPSNHDDSTAIIKNKVGENRRKQKQGVLRDSERSWKLLAEAEYWEHLAAAALVH